jgi:hypothetical protein
MPFMCVCPCVLQAWILEAIFGALFVVDLLLGFHVQYAVRWEGAWGDTCGGEGGGQGEGGIMRRRGWRTGMHMHQPGRMGDANDADPP